MFAKYRGIVCGIIAATLFVCIASAEEKEPVAVLELGGTSAWNVPVFDAVKHLVPCRIERRPPRFDMTVYPYLPQAHVAMTSAKTYLGLLTGTAS